MKEDVEEILRLHKDYSARFSNYVLKLLIEEKHCFVSLTFASNTCVARKLGYA